MEMIPVHTEWRHYNGCAYVVLMIANRDTQHPDKYPVTVIYKGRNGKIWARPLAGWRNSFTCISPAGVGL